MIGVSEEVRKDVQVNMLDKLIDADTKLIDNKHSGKFISNLTNDVGLLTNLISTVILNIFNQLTNSIIMKSKRLSSYSKTGYSEVDKTIRLNKFLSNAGICSRREADEFIKMGLVQINGKIITEMGYQVKSNDEVKYDGSRVQKSPPTYLLLNKPKGFVATSQGGKINKYVQYMIRSGLNTKF